MYCCCLRFYFKTCIFLGIIFYLVKTENHVWLKPKQSSFGWKIRTGKTDAGIYGAEAGCVQRYIMIMMKSGKMVWWSLRNCCEFYGPICCCAVVFWWSWVTYVIFVVIQFLLWPSHNMYSYFRCCWFIWWLFNSQLFVMGFVRWAGFFTTLVCGTLVYIVSLVFYAFCSERAWWLLVTMTIHCYYIGCLLCHVLITSKHCVVLYTVHHQTEHNQS